MMGWHHADRSTFSVCIKTLGITGEEWISASYLSLIAISGFMFPASLFNLLLLNRHFVLESGREEGEWTLLIVLQVQGSLSLSPLTHLLVWWKAPCGKQLCSETFSVTNSKEHFVLQQVGRPGERRLCLSSVLETTTLCHSQSTIALLKLRKANNGLVT